MSPGILAGADAIVAQLAHRSSEGPQPGLPSTG
jgi:hypothetical protein